MVAVSQDEALVDDPRRVEVAACTFDPAPQLGELETPWGARSRAALADGVARFPVVWSGDPEGDWRIVATRSRLAFAWEPTADERDRMRQLIH